jgi:hypothetical protein
VNTRQSSGVGMGCTGEPLKLGSTLGIVGFDGVDAVGTCLLFSTYIKKGAMDILTNPLIEVNIFDSVYHFLLRRFALLQLIGSRATGV